MNDRYSPNFVGITTAALVAISTFCMIGDAQAEDASATGDGQVSLETILENNLAAERGDFRTAVVTTTEKVLKIVEADYSLSARYRASSRGTMRIDVFAEDTRVFSEGKDVAGVWEWAGDQDSPANVYHEGVGALEHGIEFNLFSLAELQNRGHTIELLDQETIRDKQYYVLKVTLSDGFETYRYVNSSTWLIDISRDHRALHPGIDPLKTDIETRYDNWKTADGVTYPGRSQNVDLVTGEVLQTAIVLQSRYNLREDELDLERTYVPMEPPGISQ